MVRRSVRMPFATCGSSDARQIVRHHQTTRAGGGGVVYWSVSSRIRGTRRRLWRRPYQAHSFAHLHRALNDFPGPLSGSASVGIRPSRLNTCRLSLHETRSSKLLELGRKRSRSAALWPRPAQKPSRRVALRHARYQRYTNRRRRQLYWSPEFRPTNKLRFRRNR
jgi:hypothetical protein